MLVQVPSAMEDVGTSYGGVWMCGNMVLVQALGRLGSPSTWDEWTGNMMAVRGDAYPAVHFGQWAGGSVPSVNGSLGRLSAGCLAGWSVDGLSGDYLGRSANGGSVVQFGRIGWFTRWSAARELMGQ